MLLILAVHTRFRQARQEADPGARRRAPRNAEVISGRQPAVGRGEAFREVLSNVRDGLKDIISLGHDKAPSGEDLHSRTRGHRHVPGIRGRHTRDTYVEDAGRPRDDSFAPFSWLIGLPHVV